jgi:hypothetical protein
VRVYRLLNYIGQKAEEAEAEIRAGQQPSSVIRGVVLDERAAEEFASPKIVGPSEAKTL